MFNKNNDNNKRDEQISVTICSFVLAVLLLSACASHTPQATLHAPQATLHAPQKEWMGKWNINTKFGIAKLTVNEDGTLITAVEFNFSCGAAKGARGSIGASETFAGWPIDKDGNFELKDVPFVIDIFGDGKTNTMGNLSGQFEEGGKQASGEWTLRVNDGSTCSDIWTSIR